MKRIAILCSCVAWMGLLCVTGVDAQTRDYSAGFDRLFQLGLPDVADAEYVNVSMQQYGMGGMYDHYWEQIKLGGGAWLLDPSDGTEGRFLVQEGRVMKIYEKRHLQKLRREESADDGKAGRARYAPWDSSDGRIGGSWKAADLKADLDTLIAYLEKEDDSGRSSRRYEIESISGRVFIFAALAHRKGYPEEAATLLDRLFQKAPDPREVILSGIEHLANQQYEDAMAAWGQDQDWAAFHERLNGLLQRFRTGWQMAPVVDRLNQLVVQRMESTEPPAVEGEGLTELDQVLARQLADAPTPSGYQQHGLWIFPVQQSMPWGADTNHVLYAIKARGIESVPLLLALLDDMYLTSMRMNEMMGSTIRYGTSRRSEMDEEMFRRLFDSLTRPATRSDVARVLLSELINQEKHSSVSGKSVEDIRLEAEDWYERQKDRPLTDIAREYLAEGTEDQRATAGQYLLRSGDEEQIRRVEKVIRENADPVELSNLALAYAQTRGAEGRELVTNYVERLHASLADIDPDRAWQKSSIERTIKQLEEIVSGRTAEDYLADVVSGSEPLNASSLMRLLARESKREAVRVLLDSAVAAESAPLRMEILQLLFSHTYWNRMQGSLQMGMPAQEAEEIGPWAWQDYRTQWETLLADERFALDASRTVLTPVKVRAAQALLWLAAGEGDQAALHVVLGVLGERGQLLSVERARMLLEGEELPALPRAEDVDPVRRAALHEQLMATTPADVPSLLVDYSNAEIMALTEMALGDHELGAHLLPVANRVVGVHVIDLEGEEESFKAKLGDGRTLNRVLIEELLAILRIDDAAERERMISLYRGPALDGVNIVYAPGFETESPYSRMFASEADAPHIVGYVYGLGSGTASARWLLSEPEPAEGTAPAESDLLDEMLSDMDEQLDRASDAERAAFWEGLQGFSSEEKSPFLHGLVHLRTVAGRPSETELEIELE